MNNRNNQVDINVRMDEDLGPLHGPMGFSGGNMEVSLTHPTRDQHTLASLVGGFGGDEKGTRFTVKQVRGSHSGTAVLQSNETRITLSSASPPLPSSLCFPL